MGVKRRDMVYIRILKYKGKVVCVPKNYSMEVYGAGRRTPHMEWF
jgi:hypothetical protein